MVKKTYRTRRHQPPARTLGIAERHHQNEIWQEARLGGMLFLIGVREMGRMPDDFTKEQKVDLMHVGLCAVLAPGGYFKVSHQDQDGWPHWEQLMDLPHMDIFSQEVFMKSFIVDYFADIYDI
jgi:hypothetical protein